MPSFIPPLALLIVLIAAIVIAVHPKSRTYGFASWVVAAVLGGLIYPKLYLDYLPTDYSTFLNYLLQIAMFGMGATLTVEDFQRILKMPKAVFVGAVLQFSVMPFLGWSLSKALSLPPELTLGMILLGASPGGISSNVITYLAKGNVALSVTMTAVSTLLAPVMTPLMVYVYARETIEVDYVKMFLSIINTVVVPVALGLIANMAMKRLKIDPKRAERFLALVSMVAICGICGLIAAKSQSQIVQVGLVLLVGVTLHNLLGYLLGYWGSRFAGLNICDSRTVAIEVGLQNGGMAANLAVDVLKNASAAIAPALFAPVMNVSGSILASIWAQSPSPDTEATDPKN
ncbi:MAG: bile acid:sodium symporter family protein [Planctomycetaceae bacterium]|jgi:BASS family bile acid:Na+ symporter|nr:bile acid:sodium symporter family protein [Planctomycetaceae bacterium]